jgi:hypothetical protein
MKFTVYEKIFDEKIGKGQKDLIILVGHYITNCKVSNSARIQGFSNLIIKIMIMFFFSNNMKIKAYERLIIYANIFFKCHGFIE